jgi:type I pantothenate kinase
MQHLVSLLEARRPTTGPFLIGVTGGVSAGKSTLSTALAAELTGDDGPGAVVVSTDGFLWSNEVLEQRGLTMEKGFPASFDVPSFRAAVAALVAGDPVSLPSYSHRTYDIEPDRRIDLDPRESGPIILEGLHLTRFAGDLLAPIVYLHAEEADVEEWYVDRFLDLVAAAEHDPESFYRLFVGPDRAALDGIARHLWSAINLVNLREHIAPWRDRADIVVRLGPDHQILDVTQPRNPELGVPVQRGRAPTRPAREEGFT